MILIDSNFFIGLVNNRDQWHSRAIELVDEIEHENRIVADLVIIEAITLTGSLLGGKVAKSLYDNIKDNYKICDTRHLYDKAMISYLHYNGSLSLTDVLLIELMKEKNIHKIVSFDSNFDKIRGILRIF